MANHQACRVTGFVLNVDTRSGDKRQEDGTVKSWSMTTARVLVGGVDICDVTLPNSGSSIPAPTRGEEVDWLVRVSMGTGKYLNIDYVSPFETDSPVKAQRAAS